MPKIRVVVLLFLFLCQTAEGKELSPDIQLLIAHGFIKEAKLELIAVARNPENSDPEKIQALLLLDTIASNNTEKKVVLEMLCDIDNKYLPQLKQFEADVLKEKEQEKLAQQRLRDEERAKQYLEHAKLWRKRIREWKDSSDYYDYEELVASMEFWLNKALNHVPNSDVSKEAFEFYFDILFQDLIIYKPGFFSSKFEAKNFEESMAKIVNGLEIYETMYPDAPEVLELMWNVHDTFYRLSLHRQWWQVIPRKRSDIKGEHRHLIYFRSMFDMYMLSLEWLDRIMKRSEGKENFYSDMARRKYRFMSRYFHRYVDIEKDEKNQYRIKSVLNAGGFRGVAEEDLKKIQVEISLRVTKYPVIEISSVSQ